MIACVWSFLASCDTAKRDSADAFRGLAPQLIAAGVPAVLAMREQVPIVTAQRPRTFYRRLLAHGIVDLAADEARSHVITARLPWRVNSGAIDAAQGRTTVGANREELTKRLMLLASLAVLLGMVSAFFLRGQRWSRCFTRGAEALDAEQGPASPSTGFGGQTG